ncbi:hypothetical protein HPB51_020808 [Rhipicephalus microplus]|uniref:NADH dehydrogenase [ubiquinone] 1 alpha subcomplex subunit 8 n=1 Tax=Rhipicephalus microplus TaxID=6941 RepID=A0A9J6DQB4_RHIMP|nr:hypothetical protein HPB51_020808 [Rhipicephalus microplus]
MAEDLVVRVDQAQTAPKHKHSNREQSPFNVFQDKRKDKEFMLCRSEERDPRKCLAEGREVTKCALDFFRKAKKACRKQFDEYATCLEWSSSEMDYYYCRKTQAALDSCMLDKLGIERPHLGYFSMPRIHHTERPRPEKGYRDDYPQTPKVEDDFPRTPARFGTRSIIT